MNEAYVSLDKKVMKRSWRRFLFLLGLLVLITVFFPAVLCGFVGSPYIVNLLLPINKLALDAHSSLVIQDFFYQRSALIIGLGFAVIAGLISILVYVLLILNRIQQGENVLLEIVQNLADEKAVSAIDPRKLFSYNNEIAGYLANILFGLRNSLIKYQADLSKHVHESERINSELKLAKDLQQSLLPKDFSDTTVSAALFDWYATLQSATEVAGDYYDCFFLDEKNILFAIGDVCGKGIAASMFVFRAVSIIRSLAQRQFDLYQENFSPAKLLEVIGKQLAQNNSMRFFLTTIVGVLNLETGKLIYANAGHLFPFLISNESIEELTQEKHDKPIGLSTQLSYQQYELFLKPGEGLLVYTDGLNEAINEENVFFSTVNLELSLLGRLNLSCKQMVDGMLADVKKFCKNVKQFDDITLLLFRWKFNPVQQKMLVDYKENYLQVWKFLIPLNAEKVSDCLVQITEKLSVAKITTEMIHDLTICCEEILLNIILHNSSISPIALEIKLFTDKIMLHFSDKGIYFDPTSLIGKNVAKRRREVGLSGGRGIQIVSQLVDEINYTWQDETNHLVIIKRLENGYYA